MALELDKEGVLKLRIGDETVRVYYRRPEPSEIIETLIRKMPDGEEAGDSQKILLANLDLGRACITGIGEGDLAVGGSELVTYPDHPAYRTDWKEVLEDACPLLLIALGQCLSTIPAFIEESALKKTSGTPEESLPAG
jgi:hypothetical protein